MPCCSNPKYTLTYFPIGGVAEPIRLTAAVGNISFTNQSLTFPEFGEWKAQNKLPLGQLPILEIDIGDKKKIVTQGDAILRFFGKKAGLYPECTFQALKVDEFLSVLQDTYGALGLTIKGAVKALISDKDWSNEEKMEIRKRWLENDFSKFMSYFEKSLKDNESGYLVGDSVTIADLKLFTMCSWFSSGVLDGVPNTVLDDYPSVKALMDKIKDLEGVKKWTNNHQKPYESFDFTA